MSQRRKITRREFLSLSAMAAVGAVASACAPAATETPEPTKPAPPDTPVPEPTAVPEATPVPEAPPEPVSAYNEAPMLADLVASGELPPVDERLPLNPRVTPVNDGIGNYGGTMRRAFKGVSDRWGPTKAIDHFFAWFDIDLNLQPHFCESWETNDDASEWTFYFREGTKFSDGVEFTADDVVWWYENEASNKDLFPSPYPKWTATVGTEKLFMDLEKVNDYAVKMIFPVPKTLFIYDLTRGPGMESFGVGCLTPSHYMKQFHIDFTDDKDALQAAATAAGFETWAEYYLDRGYWMLNPERPVVGPWRAMNPLSEELFIMERNPYYWAVDPEGNQLPYIDTIQHRLYEQGEVLNLWVTNGEIDFQARQMAMANFTLYKESEESGDYHVFVQKTASHVALQCNLTTKNAPLREFFNERNVRIALSLAVDRDEMNELAFDGFYTPRQYSPMEESPQYYPKLSNAYLDYDPDEANRLLDEAGYAAKDSEGFRLWKDGSGTLSFEIVGTDEAGQPSEDAAQILVKYFADVGVKAAYKYNERSLYQERWAANDIEAAWWGGDRTLLPLAPLAVIFRGVQRDRPWCAAWGTYYWEGPDDPNAEKPPEDHWITDIWNIWSQVEQEPDPDKQTELFFQILDIWAEELPMIGYLGNQPAPCIVKNGYRGYLDGMPSDDTVADEHFLGTETYYWEDPENHM
jgi:peptide/nickel transport system substrate-binding protein